MDFSIISALIILGGLGLIFGACLAVASRVLYVEKDARVSEIEEVLPGVNCGACGAPGCSGFASGIVENKYPVNGCTVGGDEVAQKVAAIMGVEAEAVLPKVVVVRCAGDVDNCSQRAIYHGIQDCRAAVLVGDGAKACVYGCLGMGSCVEACNFDALKMSEKGLPVVDEDKCIACGDCVEACPRSIMELVPRDQKVFIACMSKDFGKAVKSVCKVGCIGCSLCANPKTTENEAITMEGKLPVVHHDRCGNSWLDLKNAVNKCPTRSFGVRALDEAEKAEEAAETDQS